MGPLVFTIGDIHVGLSGKADTACEHPLELLTDGDWRSGPISLLSPHGSNLNCVYLVSLRL